jgi:hypothetical protein
MRFIRIIEFSTSRIDELTELDDEWLNVTGSRLVREMHCVDRDRPGKLVALVEFDSFEAAMNNADRPEVRAIAERFEALCDEPPTVKNLDVLDSVNRFGTRLAAPAVLRRARTGWRQLRRRP